MPYTARPDNTCDQQDPLAHLLGINAMLQRMGAPFMLQVCHANYSVSYISELVGDEPEMGGDTYQDDRIFTVILTRRNFDIANTCKLITHLFNRAGIADGLLRTNDWAAARKGRELFLVSLSENIQFEGAVDSFELGPLGLPGKTNAER